MCDEDVQGERWAWVCEAKGAPLVKKPAVDEVDLAPDEVRVRVLWCGCCFSDVGLLGGHYGNNTFPLVAGHEVSGVVEAVGAAVAGKHVVGGRVAVGVYRAMCGDCEHCASGDNNLCPRKRLLFAAGGQDTGGFASHVVAPADFVFAVPDDIALEHAAPLMCAGVTAYAPFDNYGINARNAVGVLGLGGLGHLALQFARAHGCRRVVALSSSSAKEEEARSLGATEYVVHAEKEQLGGIARTLDYLLVTASTGKLPWKSLLSVMAPGGTVVVMTASLDAMDISPGDLIPQQLTIAGSASGSRAHVRGMFAIASAHDVRPVIEKASMNDVNDVLAKAAAGRAHYRLVMSTE